MSREQPEYSSETVSDLSSVQEHNDVLSIGGPCEICNIYVINKSHLFQKYVRAGPKNVDLVDESRRHVFRVVHTDEQMEAIRAMLRNGSFS